MKQQRQTGSSLDDFLAREGILEEVEEVAAKRVFVFQLEQEMKKQKIDKSKLADRMDTSRSAIDRFLDPTSSSTLRTFAKAARAIGRRIKISLV